MIRPSNAVASLLFACAVAVGGVASQLAYAESDARGCEGLTAFAAEVLPIGREWAEDLEDSGIIGDRDPTTLSSDEWLDIAEMSLTYNRAFRDLEPPDWLENWVQLKVERTCLTEQLAKAVAGGGILMIIGFEDSLNALEAQEDAAKAEAIEHCPDFAQFAYDWDALDGEIDGTPVTVPTPD